MFLVQALKPGGGVSFEADSNLWDAKAAIATKLIRLSLGTLDPVQAIFFVNAAEVADLQKTYALYNMSGHDVRI